MGMMGSYGSVAAIRSGIESGESEGECTGSPVNGSV
jgi:hypothetical protein